MLPASAPHESAATPADQQVQVRVLEAQLATMREFQSSVLDTVYWALSGVFLALGLIFGFSWFSNFKLSERDRHTLHEEMEARLAGMRLELTAATATASAGLDARLEEVRQDAQYQLDRFNEEVRKSATQAIEQSATSIQSQITRLELDMLRLAVRAESDATKRQEYLRRYLSGTITSSTYGIPSALSLVNALLDGGLEITAQEASMLNAILSKVPGEHAAHASHVRDKVIAKAK